MFNNNSSITIYNQRIGYSEQRYHARQAETALNFVDKFDELLRDVDKLSPEYRKSASMACYAKFIEYLKEHGMIW